MWNFIVNNWQNLFSSIAAIFVVGIVLLFVAVVFFIVKVLFFSDAMD